MVKNEKINSVHYNVMMNDCSYYIMYLLARPLMVLYPNCFIILVYYYSGKFALFFMANLCFYDIGPNYESDYTYHVITTQQE